MIRWMKKAESLRVQGNEDMDPTLPVGSSPPSVISVFPYDTHPYTRAPSQKLLPADSRERLWGAMSQVRSGKGDQNEESLNANTQ